MIIIGEGKQNVPPYVQRSTPDENYHENSGLQNSARVVSVTEVLLQKQDSQPGIKDCSCNWKGIQNHARTSGKV